MFFISEIKLFFSFFIDSFLLCGSEFRSSQTELFGWPGGIYPAAITLMQVYGSNKQDSNWELTATQQEGYSCWSLDARKDQITWPCRVFLLPFPHAHCFLQSWDGIWSTCSIHHVFSLARLGFLSSLDKQQRLGNDLRPIKGQESRVDFAAGPWRYICATNVNGF